MDRFFLTDTANKMTLKHASSLEGTEDTAHSEPEWNIGNEILHFKQFSLPIFHSGSLCTVPTNCNVKFMSFGQSVIC